MSKDYLRSKPYKGTAFVAGDFDSALAVGGASTLVFKTRGKQLASRPLGLLQGHRAKSKRLGGLVETNSAQCLACKQPHQLVDCYYVFKEKAPE
jgi:hypothetical protein